jgi:hypothetical protein
VRSVHLGDVGVEFAWDVGEDVSAATVHKLKYQKPTGAVGEFAATVSGTMLRYTTTLATELDVAGSWGMQAYIEMPGWKGHSDVDHFEVLRNLS